MLYMKVYLVYLLCPTTIQSDDIPVQHENIQKYVKINNYSKNRWEYAYFKSVTIHESEQCSILYNNNIRPGKGEQPKMYGFYTGMGCKCADWTITKIHNFIKSLPLFYQPKFEKQKLYKKAFKPLFEKSLTAFISSLDKYVNRFIQILNDFLDIDESYYTDTTVLEAFISLKIKMNFMSLKNNQNEPELNKSDTTIIRMILEEMNVLQRFLSMNCLDVPPGDKYSPFYGYWLNEDKLIDVNTINHFLNNIKPIGFNVDPLICVSTQMFLENFVNLSSYDHISLDIVYAQVQITDTSDTKMKTYTISIKDILLKTKTMYNIDVVFWYQDIVLNTIMTILFRKIENAKIFIDGPLKSNIFYHIENINLIISKNSTNFPEYLVNGFKLLSKYKNINEIPTIELNTYLTSLIHITIGNWDISTIGDTFILRDNLKNTCKLKDLLIIHCKVTFKPLTDIEYLECFVLKLLKHINDFKCVHQSFKCLRKKYDNYYIPLINNKKTLIPINSIKDIQKSSGVCKFVINIYSICLQTIWFINLESDNASATNDNANILRSWRAIFSMKYYFLIIIKENTDDLDLLKMSYDIAVILINLQQRFDQHPNFYNLKRTLNVIMTELNNYGIKNCSESKFNFLLFNNINFMHIGDGHFIEKSMKAFYKNNFGIDNFQNTNINMKDFKYFDVQNLYDQYVKNSEVIKLYGQFIKFSWKGINLTLKEIFEDAIISTLNPYSLYAVYDMYFKFNLAVVHFEMGEILIKNKFKNLRNIQREFLDIQNVMTNFVPKYFPSEFESIILDMQSLLSRPSNNTTDITSKKLSIFKSFKKYKESVIDEISVMNEITECYIKIDNQFKKFKIKLKNRSFFQKNKKEIKDMKIVKHFTKDDLKTINFEISNKIADVNEYFSQLHRRDKPSQKPIN